MIPRSGSSLFNVALALCEVRAVIDLLILRRKSHAFKHFRAQAAPYNSGRSWR